MTSSSSSHTSHIPPQFWSQTTASSPGIGIMPSIELPRDDSSSDDVILAQQRKRRLKQVNYEEHMHDDVIFEDFPETIDDSPPHFDLDLPLLAPSSSSRPLLDFTNRRGRNGSGNTVKKAKKSSEEKAEDRGDDKGADSSDVFIAEKIKKRAIRKGVPHYLVKWKGYADSTWEPQENILDPCLIQMFHNEQQQLKKKKALGNFPPSQTGHKPNSTEAVVKRHLNDLLTRVCDGDSSSLAPKRSRSPQQPRGAGTRGPNVSASSKSARAAAARRRRLSIDRANVDVIDSEDSTSRSRLGSNAGDIPDLSHLFRFSLMDVCYNSCPQLKKHDCYFSFEETGEQSHSSEPCCWLSKEGWSAMLTPSPSNSSPVSTHALLSITTHSDLDFHHTYIVKRDCDHISSFYDSSIYVKGFYGNEQAKSLSQEVQECLNDLLTKI